MDIATLAYKVDSSGLVKGTQELDKHAAAAKRTEGATAKLEKDWGRMDRQARKAEGGIRSLNREFDQLTRGLRTGNVASMSAAMSGLGQAAIAAAGPLGYLAATAGAVALAYDRGAREALAFERALILTGNRADTTSQALADMAARFDALSGVTTASAAKGILEVASAGTYTRAEIELVTEAALKMSQASGESFGAVARHFQALRKDPVRALLDLNEQLNFVTPKLYEQVRALEESGNHAGAAALAMKSYADMIGERTPRVLENLGYVEQAWRGIKGAATEAWDAIIGIGRAPTSSALGESIKQMEAMLRTMPGGSSASPMQIAQRRRLERELAHARSLLAQRGVDEGLASGGASGILDSQAARREREEEGMRRLQRMFGARHAQMPDFTGNAAAELQKLVEAEHKARDAFEQRAAVLAGPLADANYRYAVDLQQLRDLADEGGVAARTLAEAEANLTRQHETSLAAIERRLNPAGELIRSMEAELALMKMSHVDRELAIRLRHLDADATEEQVSALRRLIQEQGSQQDLIKQMDALRYAGSDLMTEWATGAEKFGDALESSLKQLHRQLTQIAMDRMIQQLLGSFGTSEAGAVGGWLSNLFGGGRRHGGPVRRDRMYEVNEGGIPELLDTPHGRYLLPGSHGNVTPLSHAAPVAGGSSAPMQVIINNSAPGVRAEAREERMPNGDGSELRRLVVSVIADDLASGGKSLAALKARTGIKDLV